MKKILLFLLLFSGLTSAGYAQKNTKAKSTTAIETKAKETPKKESINAEPLQWFTDFQQANDLSQKNKVPIFAFFTGSDWCGWCRKLQVDVFSKPSFIDWAKKNVILLELDFPRTKQLPEALQQQNAGLQQAFQINSFPTIWLFYANKVDSTNKINLSALGSLGYPRNPEPGKEDISFLETANHILNPAGK